MSADTWYSDDQDPTPQKFDFGDWLRILRRGVPLILLVSLGLALTLVLRLFERLICGERRPVTQWITVVVCRMAIWIIGIGYQTQGKPMSGAGAVVANHSSWLDIFALNAAQRLYFVSKAEVASWPGIGWLARATGTVFVKRSRSEAKRQIAVFRERLTLGHKLLFFPEGTSTDGLQVLPFKPTLFAAFFDPALRESMQMQAISVRYISPEGVDPRFYGWWGDMDFGPHLMATLAAKRQGEIIVEFHTPVAVRDYENRKVLARALEQQVRDGLLGGDR